VAAIEYSVFLAILIIAAIYFLLILYLSYSWIKIKPEYLEVSSFKTKVSIVIPVRNEASDIIHCLQSIISQDYPSDLFEIIVCDDSSTDNTVSVVKEFILQQKQHHFKLLELSQKKLMFKKLAITEAVTAASGELIITTDGDCTMSTKWISSIVSFYEKTGSVMIAGPVFFHNEKGAFNHLQSLEFMSLVATGLGSVAGNFPVMCNGANLAYTRKVFLSVGGYTDNTRYVSGDDIFLLLKIKKLFPEKTGIIKSADAIVYTNAQKNFNKFLSQRMRWVSKSKGYRSLPAIFTSITVYLANFSILCGGILSFFSDRVFYAFIIIVLTKFIIDFPVLVSITTFAKRRFLLLYYLPLQILYVIYVSLIGIAGNFRRNSWKGRKIS
jgi:cellulose synthase/poly-beta-1,6-N-acetylglucosamine synthase-like glycosyltransferase